jgi:hypothetical protein
MSGFWGGVMILAPSFGFCALRSAHCALCLPLVRVLFQQRTDSAQCREEAVCARPRYYSFFVYLFAPPSYHLFSRKRPLMQIANAL